MKELLPNELCELLSANYDEDVVEKITKGYLTKRIESFRVNTLLATKEEVVTILMNNNIQFVEVKEIDNAFQTDESSKIKKLSIYLEGKIYFQNLSSMLPPLFLEAAPKQDILDMAAAPGSKTSEIAALTNNLAQIMAVEPNKIRLERLKYNCNKLGVKNVNFMLQDARKLDDYFSFDRILLDAPCSGSGTLSFNDESINKFSKQLVYNSSKLQKELIKKAAKMLKKGGILIYSTCSILSKENEEVVEFAKKLGMLEQVILTNEELSFLPLYKPSVNGTLLVMPNESYEGFFIAKFRKIK